MKYGYFDEKNKEYVIIRPDTPTPWMNYLGLDEYCALISNTAGALGKGRNYSQSRSGYGRGECKISHLFL